MPVDRGSSEPTIEAQAAQVQTNSRGGRGRSNGLSSPGRGSAPFVPPPGPPDEADRRKSESASFHQAHRLWSHRVSHEKPAIHGGLRGRLRRCFLRRSGDGNPARDVGEGIRRAHGALRILVNLLAIETEPGVVELHCCGCSDRHAIDRLYVTRPTTSPCRPVFGHRSSWNGMAGEASQRRRTACAPSLRSPPVAPPPNRPPTFSVVATCDPLTVLVGETSRCTATATDPDGDPVTYLYGDLRRGAAD